MAARESDAIRRRKVWQSIGSDCTVVTIVHGITQEWRPMALALHRLPGAGAHFDLFLARTEPRGDPDERCVRTLRCAADMRGAGTGFAVAVEPAGEHRAHYLRLDEEARLADGSTVTPLARGAWCPAPPGPASAAAAPRTREEILLRWEGSREQHRFGLEGTPPSRLLWICSDLPRDTVP